jgi:pimeloyl-ACP methyl ester carboxylesterase
VQIKLCRPSVSYSSRFLSTKFSYCMVILRSTVRSNMYIKQIWWRLRNYTAMKPNAMVSTCSGVVLAASVLVAVLASLGRQSAASHRAAMADPTPLPPGTTPFWSLATNTSYLSLGGGVEDGQPQRQPLCFQLWGGGVDDGQRTVVVYFAGLAGSHLEQFATAADNTTLVLTIDRPGLGCTPAWAPPAAGSTRYTAIADAVLLLLRQLKVSRFAVVGWSSGGPFALALAHQHSHQEHRAFAFSPELVRVATVAADPPWANVSYRTLLCSPHHAAAYLILRWLPRPWLGFSVGRGFEIAFGAHAVATRWLPLRMAQAAEGLSPLVANFGEALRRGGESELAIADEFFLERSVSWGFELSHVRAPSESSTRSKWPLHVFHSPGDRVVPYESALYLMAGLPAATLHRMPPERIGLFEEGHMIMETFWSAIISGSHVDGVADG